MAAAHAEALCPMGMFALRHTSPLGGLQIAKAKSVAAEAQHRACGASICMLIIRE